MIKPVPSYGFHVREWDNQDREKINKYVTGTKLPWEANWKTNITMGVVITVRKKSNSWKWLDEKS